MIFQGAIDLELENRNVQAIIDFDTGLIGFTEIVEGKTIEYFFSGSPKEFKVALFEKLEALFAQKSYANFKICSKSETIKAIGKYLTENK